ncbi:hypothetical protein ABZ553_40880, partial [Streptomyces sparsogenes]|uniref:hypothetical protein n=1 Tax=Streptomyces sparsogenes TaxID=67365 RepID=UPI0033EA54B2
MPTSQLICGVGAGSEHCRGLSVARRWGLARFPETAGRSSPGGPIPKEITMHTPVTIIGAGLGG